MGRLRDLAPGVLVATSRRELTTSTVVTAAPEGPAGPAVLIDPAWEPDELAGLAHELDARQLVVAAGLATHAHYDHLLWHPGFGDAPRWASPETARRARGDQPRLLAGLGASWPPELAALVGQVQPAAGSVLGWEGPEITLIVHDAHLPGHTAAWVEDRRLLVAGDMLSDQELPLLSEEPGALGAYREGLERLAPFAARASLLVPGHGRATTEGSARLDADRRYLDALAENRPVEDARLAHPGMAQAHRAARRRVG